MDNVEGRRLGPGGLRPLPSRPQGPDEADGGGLPGAGGCAELGQRHWEEDPDTDPEADSDTDSEDDPDVDPVLQALRLPGRRACQSWLPGSLAEDEDAVEDAVEPADSTLLQGLPAADDVLNLVILDVDDDDLDDDCGVAGAESSPPSFAAVTTGATTVQDSTRRRSSATVSTEIVSKMTEFAREGRETTCPTGAAAAYPVRADAVPASSSVAHCYEGLSKRLEPFARHAKLDAELDAGQEAETLPLAPENGMGSGAGSNGPVGGMESEGCGGHLGGQPALSVSRRDSGSRFCRICRDTCPPLASPCQCRGSVAWVHVDCLERWLAESDTTACELCGHEYATTRTPSYNMLASVPLWMIANGSTELLFDLVAFFAFTPVALFGTRLGLEADDGDYFQVTLMAAIDLVYSAWLTMRLHYHAIRWYSWWRRKSTVKVMLDREEPTMLTES